jgi:hypothetical protein
MTDDRAQLERLVTALDASPLALQRDNVRGEGRIGDLAIHGTLGHIYPDGAGYLLYVASDESARRWSNVKARLRFCHLLNDGDDEGCFHLDRLPTPTEATKIREVLGIRKRRKVTDKARIQLEAARSLLNRPLASPY